MANMYADILQENICGMFADNGCMTQLPNYVRLCSSSTESAQAVVTLSTVLIFVGLLVSMMSTVV